MQVRILPAAPLPDSVKVARRYVKPLVLVRVQVWQPVSICDLGFTTDALLWGVSSIPRIHQLKIQPGKPMKIFTTMIRFLFRNGTKTEKRDSAAAGIDAPVAKPAHQPKAHPCTDDDSPPGYKIRWHQ